MSDRREAIDAYLTRQRQEQNRGDIARLTVYDLESNAHRPRGVQRHQGERARRSGNPQILARPASPRSKKTSDKLSQFLNSVYAKVVG
jgi:hypothetical protein